MASSIVVADLKVTLTAETKEFTDGLASATRKAGRWAADIGRTIATAGLAVVTGAATIAATAIAGVGAALVKLTLDAAPLEGIGRAFENMSDKVGVSLDSLRTSAAGTISDFELMRQANVALTGAGEEFGQEFGQALPALLEGARAAARATGQDVGFLFESLVTGVKRSSPLLIDNTGIVLKVGEANEALAESLGITVEEMSAEQKQIALLNATVAAAGKLTDEMGMEQLTASERIAQFKAQIKNTGDQIGLSFLPALSEMLAPMSDIAGNVGPKLIEWAQTAGQWLGTNLPNAIQAITSLLEGDFQQAINSVRGIIARTFGGEGAAQFDIFVEKAKEIVSAIRAIFSGDFRQAFDLVRDAIGSAFGAEGVARFDTFVSGIRTATGILLDVVQSISDWFTINWPMIQAVAVTAWTVIQAIIQTVSDTITGSIWPSLQAAFESITAALATLGLDWTDVWEAIKTALGIAAAAIGALLLGLVAVIVGIVDGIAAALEKGAEVFETWASAVKGVVEGAAAIVGNFIEFWKNIFRGDFLGAINSAKGYLKGLVDFVGSMFTLMITLITGPLQVILEAIRGFVESVISFFEDLFDELVGGSIIPDMMADMLQVFVSGFVSVINAIKVALNNIIAAIVEFVVQFKAVGEQLMQGLKEGIMLKVNSIIGAIRDAIQSMISAARDALGSFSPSRVFMEIGESAMTGMAIGIAGTASIPAAATVGAVSNVISTAIDNSRSATLNVNTQATTPGVISGFETARALWG